MPLNFNQVCLVTVKLSVLVNEAFANYRYRTIGKKYSHLMTQLHRLSPVSMLIM